MPGDRREVIHLPVTNRIKDGRIFEISNRAQSGIIYLRCRTAFCHGTAKIMPNTNHRIVIGRQHSAICYADNNAQLKANFMEALKAMLQRNYWKLSEVYETVAAMFPVEIKQRIPHNSIKSSLKRWRKIYYPPCPETLQMMTDILQDPENQRLMEYDVGRLTCKTVNDTDGQLHAVIYDEQLVRNEFANIDRIFIDGTFQTTPRVAGVYQLVSILGIKYDHALPFAHILMPNKTQAGYMAVLGALRDNMINNASVRVVMSDFEQALRNASRLIFPNALLVGCNAHYDRAVLKKMKSLGLAPIVREDADAKLFVRKILALAYLPQDSIEAQYHGLKANLTLALKRRFIAFLTYYERQWLRIIKPAGFSVSGLSRRTNNVLESYNSILANKLGVHPRPWSFMDKLVKLTSNARDDIVSLRLSKNIKRHPRYATIYKHRELMKAWRQLHSNQMMTSEFLDLAAMLKGHLSQRLMRVPDGLPDDGIDMVETPIDLNIGQ